MFFLFLWEIIYIYCTNMASIRLHPQLQEMGVSFPTLSLKRFIASYCKCCDKHEHAGADSEARS